MTKAQQVYRELRKYVGPEDARYAATRLVAMTPEQIAEIDRRRAA